MSNPDKPIAVLVHGAYAESQSWSGVIEQLQAAGYESVALANPLRGVAADADYLASILAGLDRPTVLVGHSYGGMVISQGARGSDKVRGLVFVSAFAPEPGESAADLSGRFPGSSLGETLVTYPLPDGSNETYIDQAKYRAQFAADGPADVVDVMSVTQRPIPDRALGEAASSDEPAWKRLPSWFVFGELDKNIPVAVHRFMAERAHSRGTDEVAGGSHAVGVAQPDRVASIVLTALRAAEAGPTAAAA